MCIAQPREIRYKTALSAAGKPSANSRLARGIACCPCNTFAVEKQNPLISFTSRCPDHVSSKKIVGTSAHIDKFACAAVLLCDHDMATNARNCRKDNKVTSWLLVGLLIVVSNLPIVHADVMACGDIPNSQSTTIDLSTYVGAQDDVDINGCTWTDTQVTFKVNALIRLTISGISATGGSFEFTTDQPVFPEFHLNIDSSIVDVSSTADSHVFSLTTNLNIANFQLLVRDSDLKAKLSAISTFSLDVKNVVLQIKDSVISAVNDVGPALAASIAVLEGTSLSVTNVTMASQRSSITSTAATDTNGFIAGSVGIASWLTAVEADTVVMTAVDSTLEASGKGPAVCLAIAVYENSLIATNVVITGTDTTMTSTADSALAINAGLGVYATSSLLGEDVAIDCTRCVLSASAGQCAASVGAAAGYEGSLSLTRFIAIATDSTLESTCSNNGAASLGVVGYLVQSVQMTTILLHARNSTVAASAGYTAASVGVARHSTTTATTFIATDIIMDTIDSEVSAACQTNAASVGFVVYSSATNQLTATNVTLSATNSAVTATAASSRIAASVGIATYYSSIVADTVVMTAVNSTLEATSALPAGCLAIAQVSFSLAATNVVITGTDTTMTSTAYIILAINAGLGTYATGSSLSAENVTVKCTRCISNAVARRQPGYFSFAVSLGVVYSYIGSLSLTNFHATAINSTLASTSDDNAISMGILGQCVSITVTNAALRVEGSHVTSNGIEVAASSAFVMYSRTTTLTSISMLAEGSVVEATSENCMAASMGIARNIISGSGGIFAVTDIIMEAVDSEVSANSSTTVAAVGIATRCNAVEQMTATNVTLSAMNSTVTATADSTGYVAASVGIASWYAEVVADTVLMTAVDSTLEATSKGPAVCLAIAVSERALAATNVAIKGTGTTMTSRSTNALALNAGLGVYATSSSHVLGENVTIDCTRCILSASAEQCTASLGVVFSLSGSFTIANFAVTAIDSTLISEAESLAVSMGILGGNATSSLINATLLADRCFITSSAAINAAASAAIVGDTTEVSHTMTAASIFMHARDCIIKSTAVTSSAASLGIAAWSTDSNNLSWTSIVITASDSTITSVSQYVAAAAGLSAFSCCNADPGTYIVMAQVEITIQSCVISALSNFSVGSTGIASWGQEYSFINAEAVALFVNGSTVEATGQGAITTVGIASASGSGYSTIVGRDVTLMCENSDASATGSSDSVSSVGFSSSANGESNVTLKNTTGHAWGSTLSANAVRVASCLGVASESSGGFEVTINGTNLTLYSLSSTVTTASSVCAASVGWAAHSCCADPHVNVRATRVGLYAENSFVSATAQNVPGASVGVALWSHHCAFDSSAFVLFVAQSTVQSGSSGGSCASVGVAVFGLIVSSISGSDVAILSALSVVTSNDDTNTSSSLAIVSHAAVNVSSISLHDARIYSLYSTIYAKASFLAASLGVASFGGVQSSASATTLTLYTSSSAIVSDSLSSSCLGFVSMKTEAATVDVFTLDSAKLFACSSRVEAVGANAAAAAARATASQDVQWLLLNSNVSSGETCINLKPDGAANAIGSTGIQCTTRGYTGQTGTYYASDGMLDGAPCDGTCMNAVFPGLDAGDSGGLLDGPCSKFVQPKYDGIWPPMELVSNFSQDGLGFGAKIVFRPLHNPIHMAAHDTSLPQEFILGSFACGVLDGHSIWLIPRDTQRVIKIAKKSVAVSIYDTWPLDFLRVSAAFHSAAFDGQYIWMLPGDADRVIKMSTSDGSMTGYNSWPSGITQIGNHSFNGAAFDGYFIWMAPFNSEKIVAIRKADGTMFGSDEWPDTFTKTDEALSGAVFDGRHIWTIPYNSDTIIRVDKNTFQMTAHSTWPGGGYVHGLRAFIGGIFDGQFIWMIPFNSDRVVAVSVADQTMAGYNAWPSEFTKENGAFAGGAFDGQRIWMAPANASHVVSIDVTTGVMAAFNLFPPGITGIGNHAFQGGVFDGHSVWFIPQTSNLIMKLSSGLLNQDGFGFSGTVKKNPLQKIAMIGYPNYLVGTTPSYSGGVFDGEYIWMMPLWPPQVVRVNPKDGSTTFFRNWPSGIVKNNDMFSGAVFDGTYLWAIPLSASHVVRISKTDGTMTGFNSWPTTPMVFVKDLLSFIGGSFDGHSVWMVPRDADRILKVSTIDGSMEGYGDGYWPTGFVLPEVAFGAAVFDGHSIWALPLASDRVIKVDHITASMTGYGDGFWPPEFSKDSYAFYGGVFDGHFVWLIPYRADRAIKINVDDGSMVGYNSWPSGFTKGYDSFAGGAFDGQRIWMAPANASHVVSIDVTTGVMAAFNSFPPGITGIGNHAFQGGVFDGHSVWFIPQASNLIM